MKTRASQVSDISAIVHGLAKSNARRIQLKYAKDALLDSRAELRSALHQFSAADDSEAVPHIRKAIAQIDYALKQIGVSQ